VHRKLITLAFTVLLFASPAVAQEQVTVVRKSGERVDGRFEAWNRERDAVYVRVSLGDQRIIPMADIARIEVGGGGATAGTAGSTAAGPHVLVTRGGERFSGRLANIEGGEGSGQEGQPRIVTFQTSAGERRVPMSDVAVLQFGAATGSGGSATDGPAQLPEMDAPAGTIRVAANNRWTPTPLRVRQGDRVQFDARGQIQLSTNSQDVAGTAGSTSGRKPGYGAPTPQFPAGALIGRVGENGQPFAIGDQTGPLPMNGDGILYLGINDDEVGDNRGEFVVAARVVGRRR
jgi:hypothetical protein